MKRIIITLIAGLVLLCSHSVFAQEGESSPINSITEAEMRDHIFFLASDYMGGRIGPSAEYEIAAQYVASQFAAAGLEQVSSEDGKVEGFFQGVPFTKETFSQEMKWVLQSEEGKKELIHNEDFKILEGRNMTRETLDVVFAGYGISEPEHGWNDFEKIDIEGKMVIVLAGAPSKNGKAVLPDSIHQMYSSMMGLQSKLLPVLEKKPASILLVLDKQMSAMIPFAMFPSNYSEVSYKYQRPEEGPTGLSIPMIYLAKDEVLRSIFEGQKYDPVNIEEDGIKKYRTYQLEDVSIKSEFSLVESEEIYLKNVVGMVKGTDPDLAGQIITLGAHLDHVASGGPAVANGADDNASGSAGVMEIAEAIAMNPPRRSVVFIAYAAEEMGLCGSHYFVNAGPLSKEKIKFNVNLDMIGRTTAENKDTRSHYVVTDEKYLGDLEPFISEINNESIQFPLIFSSNSNSPGNSDHASYSDVGIPSFFFFSGVHRDLHSPGDDADKIEYDKAVKLSRLAYLITMKLANMDEVPAFGE